MAIDVDVMVELVDSGNAKTVEDEWTSELEKPDCDVDQMLPIVDALIKTGQSETASTLAWATIEYFSSRFEPKQTLSRISNLMGRFTKNGDLRAQLANLYREAYGDVEGLETLIAESGLAGEKALRRAMRTLNTCLSLREGCFLHDPTEGHAAQVMAINRTSWQVSLRDKRGQRHLDPVSLGDRYEIVPEEDFQVQLDFFPDELAERLQSDPTPSISQIVRKHKGSMDANELRDFLTKRSVAVGDWSKWWSKTRAKLKMDPNIRLEGRNPIVIHYDHRARSMEDTFRPRLEKAKVTAEILTVCKDYVRDCKQLKQPVDSGFAMEVLHRLYDRAARSEKSGGLVVLTNWLLYDAAAEALGVGDAASPSRTSDVLGGLVDPKAAMLAIDDPTLWPPAIKAAKQALPERWLDVLLAALAHAPAGVMDDIAAEVIAEGRSDDLVNLIEMFLAHPMKYVEALAWLWSGPRIAESVKMPPLVTILTRMLSVMLAMRHAEDIPADRAREIKSVIRGAWSARKHARFAECLSQIEEGMASAIRTDLQRIQSLGGSAVQDMLSLVTRTFPALVAQPKVEPWQDPNVLYVTARGLARRESEIDELINVKMRENAIAIGAAAEHGDLSENSEYKFALEERDLLRARLAQMQDEMNRCRLIEAENVPTNHVGVGSRVVLREAATGGTLCVTFLGPWEANIDQLVFNYRAPFSQSLMGLKVGDGVDIEMGDHNGHYVVESLSSAVG